MTAITKTIRARPAEVKTWKSRLSADGPEVTQIRVKISSTTEDRRLILIRMADGTRGYVTAATFRKIIGEVVEEAIAPLQERINTLAAAAKAARPVTVKSGINRGRTMRKITVASTGRSL